jgi:hypothetical protein
MIGFITLQQSAPSQMTFFKDIFLRLSVLHSAEQAAKRLEVVHNGQKWRAMLSLQIRCGSGAGQHLMLPEGRCLWRVAKL